MVAIDAPPFFPCYASYDGFMVGWKRRFSRCIPESSVIPSAVFVGVSLHIIFTIGMLLVYGPVGYAAATIILITLWKIPFRRTVPIGGTHRDCLIVPGSDPNPEMSFDLEGAASHINILTFNIFFRPPGCPGGADGSIFGDEFKDERLTELLKELPRYDVVCLQEFFGFGQFRQETLLQRAASMGFKYCARGRNVSLPNTVQFFTEWIDSGLMLISKLPLSDIDVLTFTSKTGGDRWVAKGAIYAKVTPDPAHPERALHLLTCHLQASLCVPKDTAHLSAGDESGGVALARGLGGGKQEPKSESGVRRDQVDQMSAMLRRKVAGDRLPAMVLGDFNMDSNDGGCGGSGVAEYEGACAAFTASGGADAFVLRDLALEAYGTHPITFGDCYLDASGAVTAKDISLTEHKERFSQCSLDYMLLLQRAEQASPAVSIPTKVEEFLVDAPRFSQLSDHYGLSCQLPLRVLDAPSSASAGARRSNTARPVTTV